MMQPANEAGQNWPEWFTKNVRDYTARFKAYRPFPFEQPVDTSTYLALHQNDYLRLSSHPEVVEAREVANRRVGGGSMASIVYGGEADEHQRLKEKLKASLQVQDILLTTAGWTANVGVVEAVVAPDMPVFMDYFAHASLWDGANQSAGQIVPVRHNDPEGLEKRIKRYGPGVVCIDAFYSTDGSVVELKRYVEICREKECLLILDEAHSFGMIGPNGGGLAVAENVHLDVPIRTISMSKALGGHGGVIAGHSELIWYLTYRTRSVIFSSSPSPTNSAGHAAALDILIREPERAQNCLNMGALLRKLLHEYDVDTGDSQTQIVSLVLNHDQLASKFWGYMRGKGILVSVFIAPAVPKDTSLVRFSIHADTRPEDMERVAIETVNALEALGIRDDLRLSNAGRKSLTPV